MAPSTRRGHDNPLPDVAWACYLAFENMDLSGKNAKTPRGLGRGLDALLPTRQPREVLAAPQVFACPLERIVPNREQPRRVFEERALAELASSIRQYGLLEPLIVRRLAEEDKYEIIAGERRWRACQQANLREALVVVKDVSHEDAYELALIENLQREDLNAIEFAAALDHLLQHHGYTQESLAQRVGKDRSTVANALRLLKLPEGVRQAVISGELSEGHARALLGAPNDALMASLAAKARNGRLSVRQTEQLVREAKAKAVAGPSKPSKPAATRDLEARLARKLGARCTVKDSGGKGTVTLHYADLDELDRLLDLLL